MSTIFSQNRSSDISEDLEIELAGQFYPIRVRRSARSRSITVSADPIKGEVRLGLPRHGNVREALHFVQSKSGWLTERFAESLPAVPIVHGTNLSFLGHELQVDWSEKSPRKPKKIEGKVVVGGPEDRVEDRILRWMKEEARAAFQSDLDDYCEKSESDMPKLSVGDARRRWGSCSGRKSIRLNWRLIMAPPVVRRSVVAHEVAHLRHMNHSKAFYCHLDSIFEGDRTAADKWLKEHGANLYLIGARIC